EEAAALAESQNVQREESGHDASGLYDSVGADSAADESSAELSGISETAQEYFATARLEREQARDQAVSTLKTVAESEGASQESVDTALALMTNYAQWTVQEAEVEGLLASKGFTDSVVYISEDGVTVTVYPGDTALSATDTAKITDIVVEETGMAADELKIIEIK
ncbi:MAG: SpoIIIAH-like family protein, partial [Oscillospiraceae bacterium]|nr:SpoIIIAH-like family protein [Oscillospiraceae bacterium]